ncbi:MAG: hypothetical protein UT48_C0017G0002 [Parcubacteria group bacterium GW2011_GWE2_39_37]|nr:MAG: hypothetical protein UT48_C0017G0002 [Parcubacteria group bacterium GW2011_GWE2_39_37]
MDLKTIADYYDYTLPFYNFFIMEKLMGYIMVIGTKKQKIMMKR